jgi:hypothetical protein
MVGTLLLTIFVVSSYILSLYFTIMYWFYTREFARLMFETSFFPYITIRRAAIFTLGFPLTALLLGGFILADTMKTFVCAVVEGFIYLWKLALFGKEE